MPKIIRNVKENVIAASRKILLEEGYRALTMRRVADQCSIAPATLYNYYPSKDVLTASVILEDWLEKLYEAESVCSVTDDCMEGLEAVYNGLKEFGGMYSSVWSQYGSTANVSAHYHKVLLDQLCGIIGPMLERLDIKAEPSPVRFFAETLLYSSRQEESSFAAIRPFLNKLL
ncbi:MAG: TetR/AcrR family transcriptional regulator [Solobacterium sp.]|nr:TetR/AcrR family transcriptional regulator [Solobacterium sp.]